MLPFQLEPGVEPGSFLNQFVEISVRFNTRTVAQATSRGERRREGTTGSKRALFATSQAISATKTVMAVTTKSRILVTAGLERILIFLGIGSTATYAATTGGGIQ